MSDLFKKCQTYCSYSVSVNENSANYIYLQNFGNGDLIKEDGDNGKFAIYANAPKGKRFYFRPTKETSGKPQKNQILAKKLSKEKEFQSSKNFVFFWAP